MYCKQYVAFNTVSLTYLSWPTEALEEAGAAGSTDINGDFSNVDESPPLPESFSCSIRLRAKSHVSLTSWAGSKAKLFSKNGILLSKPIAPRASAAYNIKNQKGRLDEQKTWSNSKHTGISRGLQFHLMPNNGVQRKIIKNRHQSWDGICILHLPQCKCSLMSQQIRRISSCYANKISTMSFSFQYSLGCRLYKHHRGG